MSEAETEQKWPWMQKWPWIQVLFNANQQSNNMQIILRALRRWRSIRTNVYSIALSSYFKMQKRPNISACVENHLSQEALKRKSAFEGLPWSRPPALSLSEDRLVLPPALLNFSSSQLSMLCSFMIWCVCLSWRASLIQRERKSFSLTLANQKNPSPSFSQDPSLLPQVKFFICCSSSQNICFDRCLVAMSASIC